MDIRLGNRSRVNREIYARFYEGLGVKFPGPTHQIRVDSVLKLDRAEKAGPEDQDAGEEPAA